ncbi:hypothetical protein chiPu_0007315 [Chiloscyllium punctatum]|uniref:Uncharacterized protein n=7 Tax=Gnathostomata TaxID=7776 RepID=A0A401SER9_CHIPU|nr:hypothetical protein [Chiloscyllium punctatum]
MSKHIPQFCGVLGRTFMEFLKGSGDYCQAQHDIYADKPYLDGHHQKPLFCAFYKKMARMNRPAPVEITYKNMRFLITHNPTNATLNKFIEELKKYSVTTVVRVCEATYDTSPVEKEGIQFLDWPFDDGAPPSNQIVDDWLTLLRAKFREEPGCCIAVHCVAGLGRAPVLVALALIECGMKYEDAVQFIRQKRRGAFNSKQLLYLEKYRPKMRLRFKDSNGHRNNCCIQ